MTATIPSDKPRVNLALPTHSGQLGVGTCMSIIAAIADGKHMITVDNVASSLLPLAFNTLWARAINRRNSGELPCDYFVMIHSDIEATQPYWLGKMIDLLNEDESVDIVSAISPIKRSEGVTSTAIDNDFDNPRRFTMNELFTLPTTFDSEFIKEKYGHDLLFNTGLMAVRLSASWCEDFCFDFRSTIKRQEDGMLRAYCEPEDWRFARFCAERGIKSRVTRAVTLRHIGVVGYRNDEPWGEWTTDENSKPLST